MHSKSSKLNALTIYLLLSGIGSFATNTIFSINMVYQIEAVKLNPLQLVLIGTTLEVTSFIFQIPTGVLADVYSRRLSVVIGYFMMGIGFLVEGLIPSFSAVLIAQILWGAGFTFVNGAEEAWCADELGEENVGKVFIRGSQIGQVASLIGIPISIWLATYRLSIPIITGGSLLALLGIFLFLFMPEQHFHPTPKEERNNWQVMGKTMVEGVKAVRQSRILLTILAITACLAMFSEGYDRLQTDHLIKDFHFPAIGHLPTLYWFGIINAGSTILGLISSEVIRRKVDTNNHMQLVGVVFAFNVLLMISVASFALATNFYIAVIILWWAGIFRGSANPLYTTWITRNSAPRQRATIISMFGQVDAIGQIAGGPAVGLIGTLVSLRAALLTSSAILAPNIIFFVRALKLSKSTPVYIEETDEEEEIAVR